MSGLSLQQMLVAVQDRRRARAAGADIDGIVCHLRPTSLRRRQTLQNSFGGRQHFAPLWESVLPEDRRSPLQDEQDVLSRINEGDLDDDVRRFIDDRRNICASPGMRDSVLWGISDVDGAAGRLSPHSVFGENLRARAAYAAIGSAVHDARMYGERDRGAPLWRQFEITAILSSYYDPIILACIFRWIQPGEIWWGDRPTDASAAITDMIHRTGDGRALLMSELLLATAEGKVVTAAAEALEALAGAFIAAYPGEQSLCLRAGLAVLDASRSG